MIGNSGKIPNLLEGCLILLILAVTFILKLILETIKSFSKRRNKSESNSVLKFYF